MFYYAVPKKKGYPKDWENGSLEKQNTWLINRYFRLTANDYYKKLTPKKKKAYRMRKIKKDISRIDVEKVIFNRSGKFIEMVDGKKMFYYITGEEVQS